MVAPVAGLSWACVVVFALGVAVRCGEARAVGDERAYLARLLQQLASDYYQNPGKYEPEEVWKIIGEVMSMSREAPVAGPGEWIPDVGDEDANGLGALHNLAQYGAAQYQQAADKRKLRKRKL